MLQYFASATTATRAGFVQSRANTRSVAMHADSGSRTVLVTGAGGKTGKLVARKVKDSTDFALRALCRTDESKDKLKSELGLEDSECVVADVTNSDLSVACKGCDAMIVVTSATPKIVYTSLPGFMWKRFVMKEKVMPSFTFPQPPEQIDWQGQKAQFDAAKAAGIKHIVLVSSMGGTQPDNTLNKIGDGNILMWKRKAEMYLKDSGLDYTIIHPGGLADKDGGTAPIILGTDDKFLGRTKRSITRSDVAELCLQSLRIPAARNRSIDCINDSEASEDVPPPKRTEDFASLFKNMTQNCDYSINKPA